MTAERVGPRNYGTDHHVVRMEQAEKLSTVAGVPGRTSMLARSSCDLVVRVCRLSVNKPLAG